MARRSLRRRSAAAFLVPAVWAALLAGAEVQVSDFGDTGLTPWEERRFEGQTRYTLVEDRGRTVLDALSRGTASGLYRQLEVNLAATPTLSWSWWIERPVPVADPRHRDGDDFAARVYVVFSGGLAFWRTTALVYVWADASVPVESSWENPFTDNARVIAIRSGGGSTWQTENRDVRADYLRLFGREPPAVSAVALMTDTDQTGKHAHARYGLIRFRTSPERAEDDEPRAKGRR